jgi:Ni/Co efflux regulator RcnB
MKRLLLRLVVVAVMAAMMVASAMPAFADANLNAHNCEGSAISGFVPRAVQKGRQADYASNQAQSGTRGDSVESDTALRANCGNNNR